MKINIFIIILLFSSVIIADEVVIDPDSVVDKVADMPDYGAQDDFVPPVNGMVAPAFDEEEENRKILEIIQKKKSQKKPHLSISEMEQLENHVLELDMKLMYVKKGTDRYRRLHEQHLLVRKFISAYLIDMISEFNSPAVNDTTVSHYEKYVVDCVSHYNTASQTCSITNGGKTEVIDMKLARYRECQKICETFDTTKAPKEIIPTTGGSKSPGSSEFKQ
jgi:hypothetical protein